MPISRCVAKNEYCIKSSKILDSIPQLQTIPGIYSTNATAQPRYHAREIKLLSRDLVSKVSGRPSKDDDTYRHTIRAYQRYQSLTAFPCYNPQSKSLEKGKHCAGCVLDARVHRLCTIFEIGDLVYDYEAEKEAVGICDENHDELCSPTFLTSLHICLIKVARDRLYDSKSFLAHLLSCEPGKALLKRE